MGFSLSPTVSVREFDKTLTVPSLATSIGAIVGHYKWGPVEEVRLIDSEAKLIEEFGKPDAAHYADWFPTSNFLAYSNNLRVVRSVGSSSVNALGEIITIPTDGSEITEAGSITAVPILIKNEDDWSNVTHVAQVPFYSRYPGAEGNKLTVSCINGAWAETASPTNWDAWTYNYLFDYEPTGDEIFIVVEFDGVVVETFIASQDSSSTGPQGGTNYWVEMLNRSSKYIFANEPAVDQGISHQNDGVSTSAAYSGTLTAGYTITPVNYTQTFEGGVDDAPLPADYMVAWDLFGDAEGGEDINFAMQAGAGSAVGQYILENICEVRKDCIALMSPNMTDVVNDPTPALSIAGLRAAGQDFATSSSFGFIDGNYKKQYDKYNDTYWWVALNGDIGGIMANTDDVRDPWWSPGGLNRGQIKNVVKLAFNPTKAQRDELYRVGINPIVSFKGEGTVLWGDKTAQTKPSAFDRVNVRRLFITLEKAIATAARYQMFEFNDFITRTDFLNLVEPYLRLVQGRRGIYDYRVVCDETNNTPEVIDRNEFVADIYIKPSRSINFIQLNFIAVKTGVNFEEITF
jgi:hypothetical protein